MFLENFVHTHYIIWLLIILFWMLITNIFPIMFFILPDIFIFLGIFLVKSGNNIFLPYISLVIWASIWEFINFYLWYNYSETILKNKLMQKNISQKLIKNFQKNPIKTLVLWKLIPWIIWIIPIISWIIKMKPLKFFIINTIMVCIAIWIAFIVWILWINIWETLLWKKVWMIIGILVFILFIYHIWKILIKKK